MTEQRKARFDRWLVRVSLMAGIVNAVATAASPILGAPVMWPLLFSAVGITAFLVAVVSQHHALQRHQPLLEEKDSRIAELLQRLERADSAIAEQSRKLDARTGEAAESELARQSFASLRRALPVVLEANTELRNHLSPAAVLGCLKGESSDFVSLGVSKLLTSLRNGLRVLIQPQGDHEITCALHVGHKNIASAYAAGTPSHRKVIERGYVRQDHSLPGLVRHYPTLLAGPSLEDAPPLHNGETHSTAGWLGNIHHHIQSYICKPVVTTDGKQEKAIGVLQVDSPARGVFPVGANVLVKAVNDAVGVLFQIGALADQLVQQEDPLLTVLRDNES